MSANLDLVRSIYKAWERGDFKDVEWAHADVELTVADGPSPARRTGLTGMAEAARELFSAWENLRARVDEYRQLDHERTLVLDRRSGHGRTSGVELAQIATAGAPVSYPHNNEVVKLAVYFDRDRALADLRLER